MNSNNYILRHIVHYYIEINRDRNIPLRVYSLRYLHLSHTVYTLITYSRYPDYRSCQMASAVIFFFQNLSFTIPQNILHLNETVNDLTHKHHTPTNTKHVQISHIYKPHSYKHHT